MAVSGNPLLSGNRYLNVWSPSEEGVQAYGGSYSSVTSSGSIRYEFGPDVLPGPRNSVCDTDTIEVVAVYVGGINHESCERIR